MNLGKMVPKDEDIHKAISAVNSKIKQMRQSIAEIAEIKVDTSTKSISAEPPSAAASQQRQWQWQWQRQQQHNRRSYATIGGNSANFAQRQQTAAKQRLTKNSDSHYFANANMNSQSQLPSQTSTATSTPATSSTSPTFSSSMDGPLTTHHSWGIAAASVSASAPSVSPTTGIDISLVPRDSSDISQTQTGDSRSGEGGEALNNSSSSDIDMDVDMDLDMDMDTHHIEQVVGDIYPTTQNIVYYGGGAYTKFGNFDVLRSKILRKKNKCDANYKQCCKMGVKSVSYLIVIVATLVLAATLFNYFRSQYVDNDLPWRDQYGNLLSGESFVTADRLEGWDVLRLLRRRVENSMIFIYDIMGDANTLRTHPNDNHLRREANINIDLSNINVVSVQTQDAASIFIKQSHDDNIRFVPFRKPKHSWCASMSFYFQEDCVNMHNVRSMAFTDNELRIVASGSFPRWVEVSEDTTIILNDRIFEVEETVTGARQYERKLVEVTSSAAYQSGDQFCRQNILIDTIAAVTGGIIDSTDAHGIVVNGSCYGLLYLPKKFFYRDSSVQLLASGWSSIVVDSNIYTTQMIVAANQWGSIIVRSILTPHSMKLALTDESYAEFTKIREAHQLSLVSYETSKVRIPELIDVERADIAVRNNSQMDIDKIDHCDFVQLSVTDFSEFGATDIIDSTVAYKKDDNALVKLPISDREQKIDLVSRTIVF